MLWAFTTEGLELRSEGGETRLRAVFPYGRETELAPAQKGRPALREVFAPGAFRGAVQSRRNVLFLAQHDTAKPLASTEAGTVTLTDSDAALTIEARISAAMASVTHARDFLAMLGAGLVRGLSPGFRVADGGEKVTQREGTVLRTITRADLFELSAVTAPAYPEAQIEARSWRPDQFAQANDTGRHAALHRWRA